MSHFGSVQRRSQSESIWQRPHCGVSFTSSVSPLGCVSARCPEGGRSGSWKRCFLVICSAKFVYWRQHRSVASSYGIRGILHFGDRPATLSETTLLALRARVGSEEVVPIDSSVKIGQSVKIIEGPFQGLEVVVTHLFPAKERIRVLLEFLGRSVGMEISTARVLPTKG